MRAPAALAPDEEQALLLAARSGDPDAFDRLTRPYSRELHVHCYRMTGSLDDAEDLLQETLLRAWRSIDRFEGRARVRTWLYRIATNACLDAQAHSSRRILPSALFAPADPDDAQRPLVNEPIWLQPYPDVLLEDDDPEARYARREALGLAFLAAIQFLPVRQRAALLLRDVLDYSAQESAEILGVSAASVNSALQRARAALDERRIQLGGLDPRQSSPEERALLERYVRAFETADVDMLFGLLREDVEMTMPPDPAWFRGPDAVVAFLARRLFPLRGPLRLVPVRANRQPAVAIYETADQGRLHGIAIQVLTVEGDRVSAITGFVGQRLFAAFGLDAERTTVRQSDPV